MQNKVLPHNLALLYPFIFLAATSMFVRSWFPIFFSSWPTLLFGCFLSILVVPRFLHTKWMMFIAVYSLIVLFNWYYKDDFFGSIGFVANEIARYFLFCSAIYYLILSDDKRCINWTYYIMFVMVCIAAIGSVMVNNIIPGIIRMQNRFIEEGNYSELISYYRMGVSNYLLPHGLPAIIPALILYIKRSRHNMWGRTMAFLFLSFSITLIYLSGSTTALLLSLIAISTFFMSSEVRNPYKFPLIISACVIPFILFPEIIPAIISLFSSETAEGYASHLEDMAKYTSEGAEGNTSFRIALYMQSFEEFTTSPLWGSNNPMSSHSVILDRLGTLGLIGFVPFVGILNCFFLFIRRKMEKVERSYFDVSFYLTLIMLLIKGIEDKEIWLMLFVVVPVILYKSRHLTPLKIKTHETPFYK